MVGKLVSYFMLGMEGMTLTALLSVLVFGVPLRGFLVALALISCIYMLFTLSFGLFVASFS